MRATGLGKRRPHANPSFKFVQQAGLARAQERPVLPTGEEQNLGETLPAVVSGRSRLPGPELTPTEGFAKKIAEPLQNNFRVLYLANRLGGSEKLDLAKVQSVELLASIK